MKVLNVKTPLLGLAVILITFSLFVALPMLIPELKEIRCEKITGQVTTIVYTTEIWDEDTPPDDAWTGNILSNTSEKVAKMGTGRLGLVYDSDNQNPVEVYGYLYYRTFTTEKGEIGLFEGWEGGLSDVSIDIKLLEYFGDYEKVTETAVKTEWNGYFSTDIDIHSDVLCYWIIAVYKGDSRYLISTLQDKFYYPARASFRTCEWEFEEKTNISGSNTWIWWLCIGLSAAVLSTLWLLVVRSKKKPVTTGILPQPVEFLPENKPEKAEEVLSGSDEVKIEITFPEIEEILPSVWGVSEPLLIGIKRKELIPELVELDIEYSDSSKTQIIPDSHETKTTHIYIHKDEYTIEVRYREKTGKQISSWRTIRVVVYREEMVRLFGEMLEELNLGDVKIKPDMTPREVERLLLDRLENVSKESLKRVIDGFEEANYSTHPVNRESYVRMYKAIEEITGES